MSSTPSTRRLALDGRRRARTQPARRCRGPPDGTGRGREHQLRRLLIVEHGRLLWSFAFDRSPPFSSKLKLRSRARRSSSSSLTAEPVSLLRIKNSPAFYAVPPSPFSSLSTKSIRRSKRPTYLSTTVWVSAKSSPFLPNMVVVSPNYWMKLQFRYQRRKTMKKWLLRRSE